MVRGGRLYDWWNINQVKNVQKKALNHPCIMPLEVMERIVGILPDDAIIFDPFCGSGTTRLACVSKGRDFVGCEIDKEYWDIQERRFNEYKIGGIDV